MRGLVVGIVLIGALSLSADVAERVFRTPRYSRENKNIRILDDIDRALWLKHPEQGAAPAFWRFERAFESDGTPFEIDVSADERFVLLLDGEVIARGPDRGTVENWMYQSYRLAPSAGRHVLAAVVWQAGACAPRAQMTGGGGFVLKASGDYDARLTTGRAVWRVGRLGGVRFLNETGGGGWPVGGTTSSDGTGFIDQVPSSWTDAVSARVRELRGSDYGARADRWMLFPSELPDQISARHVVADGFTVPANAKRTVLRDLGDYYCAYPILRCSGGKGAKVTWGWAESLYEPGGLKKGDRGKSEGKEFVGIWDEFRPDGRADARFTAPWWRAGRWVRIEIETADEPLEVRSLEIEESRYPLADEGAFSCDDPTWPSVAAICLRGMQMCDHEMLMDCPYYEQQMYGGDTRVQLNVLRSLSSDDRMIRRAIEFFELARRDNGMAPMNTPSSVNQESSTFTMCHLLMYGDYVMWHRNFDWLRVRLPGMRHGLFALARHEDADGLLRNLPGWRFIDWVPAWNDFGTAPGDPNEPNALENLFWTLVLRSAANVERALGDTDMSAYWTKRADRVAAAIRARFWDADEGLVADDVGHRHFSEHAQALAVVAGVLPPADERTLFAHLAAWNRPVRCSVYFRFYLFEAFFRYGRGDLFLKGLGLWRDFVKDGLKTPLESPSLDGIRDARSDCHAWGSHPLYFTRTGLAGIRPDAPGFARVRIAPAPGVLKEIRASVPHPDGKVAVNLTFEDGIVRGSVETPVPGVFVWQGRETSLVPGLNKLQKK